MNLLEFIFGLNLILLSLDHLVTGFFAIFFPEKAIKKLVVAMYGIQVPKTKEYFMLLKPWGALGIFAGLVGLLPVFDIDRYVMILVPLAILLLIRLIYRLKFREGAEESLKLSLKRNLFHVLLIFICATIIIIQIILTVGTKVTI